MYKFYNICAVHMKCVYTNGCSRHNFFKLQAALHLELKPHSQINVEKILL